MTKTITDRGIAFIRTNKDGTKNVYVAMSVSNTGKPEDVFAVHFNRSKVEVDSAVKTVPSGSLTRTSEAVHVSGGLASAVRISARSPGAGPLLRS